MKASRALAADILGQKKRDFCISVHRHTVAKTNLKVYTRMILAVYTPQLQKQRAAAIGLAGPQTNPTTRQPEPSQHLHTQLVWASTVCL